jgi:hypothetical protein
MKLLEGEQLIARYRALAHPELPLHEPILSWTPGEQPPDFSRAAYRLQSRWTKPFTSVPCFMATKRAGRNSGGSGGRRSRTSEQTHDIHLASVFLHYRAVSPELVPRWTSEATILERRNGGREKLPDAMVLDGAQRRVIEFGGAYGKEKVEGFHNYCATEDLPYEIW